MNVKEDAVLVLSRAINEVVKVGEDVEVVVLEVRGDRVRLGLRAPRDVQIDRAEVARRKMAEVK